MEIRENNTKFPVESSTKPLNLCKSPSHTPPFLVKRAIFCPSMRPLGSACAEFPPLCKDGNTEYSLLLIWLRRRSCPRIKNPTPEFLRPNQMRAAKSSEGLGFTWKASTPLHFNYQHFIKLHLKLPGNPRAGGAEIFAEEQPGGLGGAGTR